MGNSHAQGVGVGAVVQQQLGYLRMVSERGGMQCCPPVAAKKTLKLRRNKWNATMSSCARDTADSLFSLADVGAILQQQLHDVDVILFGGYAQRRRAVPDQQSERCATIMRECDCTSS
jgi:hypothetical protein